MHHRFKVSTSHNQFWIRLVTTAHWRLRVPAPKPLSGRLRVPTALQERRDVARKVAHQGAAPGTGTVGRVPKIPHLGWPNFFSFFSTFSQCVDLVTPLPLWTGL